MAWRDESVLLVAMLVILFGIAFAAAATLLHFVLVVLRLLAVPL